eukprot:TRINITY_DN8317_c0_g1_i1.p1 TRINITY_DN8317_c0_g1~~TRINITY_DN8317_c0_g1_i1.p1  ORF type:complete len:1504 (-),score=267.52 TRINITY_DN8317_c0_g1_i1:636-5147(-)
MHHSPTSEGVRNRVIGAIGTKRKEEGEARRLVSDSPSMSLCDNYVRTTKYTWYNFVPLNLFEQFQRLPNWFFLLIIILNWVLNVFGKEVSMLPLLFVLVCTLAKDGYEDYTRYRQDKRTNAHPCTLITAHGHHLLQDQQRAQRRPRPQSQSQSQLSDSPPNPGECEVRWRDIRPGHLVLLRNNEVIPADVIVLQTSNPAGVCWIETSNLDGETNLKERQVPFPALNEQELPRGIAVECGQPTKDLYHIGGTVHIAGIGQDPIPIHFTHTLLRGCTLRNTQWVVGMALYTGHDTKSMLSSGQNLPKRSRLERAINREFILLFLVLVAMCVVVAVLAGNWLAEYNGKFAPLYTSTKPAWRGFVAFWMSVVVFNVIVPIPLFVSLELIKLGQAKLMECDIKLYHQPTDSPLQVRALNIAENLGQIQYVFSDKTGTLTENIMEFRQMYVHELKGFTSPGDGLFLKNVDPYNLLPDHTGGGLYYLLLSLATCNKVLPPTTFAQAVSTKPRLATGAPSAATSMEDIAGINGTPPPTPDMGGRVLVPLDLATYQRTAHWGLPSDAEGQGPSARSGGTGMPLGADFQGESPDEVALCKAAFDFGCLLLARSGDEVTVRWDNSLFIYRRLATLEFDHRRKRMSVILETPGGHLILLCKGADTAVLQALHGSVDPQTRDALLAHTSTLSRMGLRTLWFACRPITKQHFRYWEERFLALRSEANAEDMLQQHFAELECDLMPLGVTGIEDKLQQGVGDCIKFLRDMGVRVVLLTGDKQETAVSIGVTCQLLRSGGEHLLMNVPSPAAAREFLHAQLLAVKQAGPESFHGRALVVDGESLKFALEGDGDTVEPLDGAFFELAKQCESVLCCRVTPLQKAAVVQLFKKYDKAVSLAIGDGANDVAMLRVADVGVGISGQEGQQAVMASDFAIAQFRFLAPLLAVHGHWSYQRLAALGVLYFVYKNALYAFLLFLFHFQSAYSSAVALDDINVIFYFVFYTALPAILGGILEQDYSRDVLEHHPELYAKGQKSRVYNARTFMLALAKAAWQALAVYFVPVLAYTDSDTSQWDMGVCFLFGAVAVVNVQLVLEMHRIPHVVLWVLLIGTFIPLPLTILVQLDKRKEWFDALLNANQGRLWLSLLLACAIALLPYGAYRALRYNFFPTPGDRIRISDYHKKRKMRLAEDQGAFEDDRKSLRSRQLNTVPAQSRSPSAQAQPQQLQYQQQNQQQMGQYLGLPPHSWNPGNGNAPDGNYGRGRSGLSPPRPSPASAQGDVVGMSPVEEHHQYLAEGGVYYGEKQPQQQPLYPMDMWASPPPAVRVPFAPARYMSYLGSGSNYNATANIAQSQQYSTGAGMASSSMGVLSTGALLPPLAQSPSRQQYDFLHFPVGGNQQYQQAAQAIFQSPVPDTSPSAQRYTMAASPQQNLFHEEHPASPVASPYRSRSLSPYYQPHHEQSVHQFTPPQRTTMPQVRMAHVVQSSEVQQQQQWSGSALSPSGVVLSAAGQAPQQQYFTVYM